MTNKEAIERIENLKVKAEVALSNSNTSCEWLKEDVKGTITAFTMAIDALEKQMPKKLIDNIEREWFECPTCGRVIVTYYAGERHHCKCGQALDWSNKDDE